MTQELALSTDIHVITAEINAYKRIAGEAIFEIGRRLKHVKENDLAHGQWERWCREQIEMDPSEARKFMRVVEQLGDTNRCTYTEMGLRALYEIATLPPEERERPHTVPSTGATKTVDEMTVRELREVKAALKAERERADRAEAAVTEAEDETALLRETLESIREQPPRIEYQTQTVHVPDPALSDRLKRYEARYGDIDGVVTERISNHTEVDGAAAHFAEDVQTFLMNYAHLTTFKAAFTGLSDAAYDEYKTSLDALKQFVNGMQRVLDGTPRGRAEVIDIADYRAL
ncbi:DUF3102 domain-containing protein [Paenibacillus elgii]|uniref:DUF3102 domain-containing protein n=1 Tax=Paenibacillus elgii TaxID=189691 RepID=UPI000248DED0|nr:DUF3102 domain-containing protein [Paenibacillus elgii]